MVVLGGGGAVSYEQGTPVAGVCGRPKLNRGELDLVSSSLLRSSLELSDTQSLCALNSSPPRNRSAFTVEVVVLNYIGPYQIVVFQASKG